MPQTAPTMARYPNTGLRENVESKCDATPMPGRIAMYTSGCPKNQNKCCHSSGEPPLCQVMTWSVTTSPPGIKKLVPASRSSKSRMHAARSTPNASSPRIAVTNQVQQVSGSRPSVMPLVRRSISVVMKLSAPISDAPQKIANPIIHSVSPPPCPGPTISPSALSGGYEVQPPIGAPPETKNAQIMTMSETNVVQNESMFRTGNAMSAAPIW